MRQILSINSKRRMRNIYKSISIKPKRPLRIAVWGGGLNHDRYRTVEPLIY